jgi:GNAT superfamily N-acetyltransferase
MLSAAHAGHLPALRAMIRAGAVEGSFERDLAADTPDVRMFFANLRQALVTGYFVDQDLQGNGIPRAAPGYVYWPNERAPDDRPVGFGLFKAFGDFGYELWLTGVDAAWRGAGHGRTMLTSLLATPAGRLAWTVRVQRLGPSAAVMKHLLEEHRYAVVRESRAQMWFLRNDAPPALMERMRGARIVPRAEPD